MEKFIYYNDLYLIYKDLFNENEQDIFNMYYGENLTMQEIADDKNISKARVGIIIKNVTKKLDKFEEILNVYDNRNKLNNILKLDNINEIKKNIEKILKGE